MKVSTHIFSIQTPAAPEFIDITEEVVAAVKRTRVKHGAVTVYTKHTTAAIRINEKESGFIEDFKDYLAKTFPPHQYYRHNDMKIRTENIDCDDDRCAKNGHSHCQHMLLGTSETIPIVDGKLTLGRWQRIFLVELCSPRKREVVFQVIGE
jgi:secondary thiamine-phosphate synthase enzyme